MTAAPITADKGFDAARLIMDRLDEQPVYDAAPDLLEALKGVKARAAISRAEGRS
jgi:hypothetical protein